MSSILVRQILRFFFVVFMSSKLFYPVLENCSFHILLIETSSIFKVESIICGEMLHQIILYATRLICKKNSVRLIKLGCIRKAAQSPLYHNYDGIKLNTVATAEFYRKMLVQTCTERIFSVSIADADIESFQVPPYVPQ